MSGRVYIAPCDKLLHSAEGRFLKGLARYETRTRGPRNRRPGDHGRDRRLGRDRLDALPREQQVLIARRVVVREMGIMTVGAILIVTLALRAAQSGGLF